MTRSKKNAIIIVVVVIFFLLVAFFSLNCSNQLLSDFNCMANASTCNGGSVGEFTPGVRRACSTITNFSQYLRSQNDSGTQNRHSGTYFANNVRLEPCIPGTFFSSGGFYYIRYPATTMSGADTYNEFNNGSGRGRNFRSLEGGFFSIPDTSPKAYEFQCNHSGKISRYTRYVEITIVTPPGLSNPKLLEVNYDASGNKLNETCFGTFQ